MIASNLFAEANSNGHASVFLYKILEHRSSGEAVKMGDKYTTLKSQTTAGWDFLVEWTGGT